MPRRANQGLSIGVTGHRLNRISQRQLDRLTPQVRPLLAQMAAAAPEPKLVSALAEGADRHLAELALDAGYALHAVLPFARDTYVNDFSGAASRRQFGDLLDNAEHITELAGRAGFASQAYRRANHAMLDACDLLLAVWDGQPAQGPGGTAEVVEEACRRRMPVIHVSTDPEAAPVIIWQRLGRAARGRDPSDGLPARPCGRAQLAAVVAHVTRATR